MLDGYGRNIDYLRISVTDRCNLRCVYCMGEDGIPLLPRERILSFESIRDIAAAAVGLGFKKVRLTGGEPLARKGVENLVSLLAEIRGLELIAMTTNGTLLAPKAACLARRGLGSVNISLDTLDPAEYRALTRRGTLEDVLKGIRAARAAGLPVKVNTVVMEDTPEERLEALRNFCREIGAEHQLIRRYRLDQAKLDDESFQRPPPCALCNRIRLLADGTLKPCLHSDLGFAVDPAEPEEALRSCILAKPERGAVCSAPGIAAIGG